MAKNLNHHSGSIVTNALTIDVEDYFQVSAFEHRIERRDWNGFESRVQRNTESLLALLQNAKIKATFFVLGWVAQRYPKLVRKISDAGHELASHGYWHRLNYKITHKEFTQDLLQSRAQIQQAGGQEITAYRAPSFSICNESLWTLDILVDQGFKIDSSIYPVNHDRYGMPGAPPKPHRIGVERGSIIEFPPSIWKFGRWSVPIAGGGYFRLYPLNLTKYAISVANQNQQPFMFYLHPWEIDPGQPRMQNMGLKNRLRHYVGLRHTEAKLTQLLSSFNFTTLSGSLANYQQTHSLPLVHYQASTKSRQTACCVEPGGKLHKP